MSSRISRGLAALLVIAPVAAVAQQVESDDDVTDEIIVTAQKRATALQDVPFSVAAVTAEDIKESGATNIVEVARNVPGLYTSPISDPARARLRSAASAPARWCVISRA
jgi:iron complex outermembrane receptor protein